MYVGTFLWIMITLNNDFLPGDYDKVIKDSVKKHIFIVAIRE